MPSASKCRGATIAAATASVCLVLAGATAVVLRRRQRRRGQEERRRQQPRNDGKVLRRRQTAVSAYETLIGSTPLVELTKLSALLGNGRTVFVKMECLNPGGTGKDRAALRMVRDAEMRGDLPPPLDPGCCGGAGAGAARREDTTVGPLEKSTTPDGGVGDNNEQPNRTTTIESSIAEAISRTRTGGIVVEGTSGSTGISLASLCAVRGHSAIVVMPDDQAEEKQTILRCLGAVVHVVPNAAISNPNHYVNVARRVAEEINARYCESEEEENVVKEGNKTRRRNRIRATFTDQFENMSNYAAHLEGTGPELRDQTERIGQRIDAFVMSSGTGGTISGVGRYLKDRGRSSSSSSSTRVVLVDPPGSALYNKIKHNVAYASQQSERALLRHRYDTLAEGIGLDRVTANLALGIDFDVIDDAVRVTDQEAVDMAHWLLREEGLFVGSSSAMNVVGAVRVASGLGGGRTVVTVICDGGQRHLTRFWNRSFAVGEWELEWPGDDCGRERVPDCIASIVAS